MRVKFQVKAHSTLYNILTFWHFQNCCCKRVSIDNPAVIQSYLYKSSKTGRSHVHGCSKVAMINSRSLVYISPPTNPQWSVQDNNRHIHVQQTKPNVHHWIIHAPKPQRYQSPGRYQNIKENNLVNYEYLLGWEFIQHCHIGTDLKGRIVCVCIVRSLKAFCNQSELRIKILKPNVSFS